jgi:RNA polymerase sigma-70 factor (ECF subfamily)
MVLGKGIAADMPSPSSLASRKESALRLADALARLPADYQTVLVLRVLEELPAEEVAQRMGRTAGAVRMLQMRALAALRTELGGEAD